LRPFPWKREAFFLKPFRSIIYVTRIEFTCGELLAERFTGYHG
jgi:hypothetical protein